MDASKEAIDRISFSNSHEEKMYYLKEIMESTPRIILKTLQTQQVDIESLIRRTNPNVVDVDIDTDHPELLRWNELEKVKMIEKIDRFDIEPYAEEWLRSVSEEVLGDSYQNMVRNKGLKELFEESVKFREGLNDHRIEETQSYQDFMLFDDIRYEVMKGNYSESNIKKWTTHVDLAAL